MRLVLFSLVGLTIVATVATTQENSRVTVKFHEPRVETTEVVIPVEPQVRINISGATQMMFGLQVDGRIPLCLGSSIRTTFKIDDRVQFPAAPGFARLSPTPQGKAREGLTTAFNANDLSIRQEIEVVPSIATKPGEKRARDTAMIRYIVENNGTAIRKLGIRMRMDAYCNTNDGALFAAPTLFPKKILDGIELKDKTLPDYVQILERPDLTNPGFVGHFTLKMRSGLVGPDKFVCTNHGAVDNGWDVGIQQANGDSDAVIFWNPREIPPGAKVVFAYAYGKGIATLPESEGRVKIAMGGSFEPEKTFSITATVEDPLSFQTLTLELPKGMTLVEGKMIQPVPLPLDQSQSQVLWKCRVLSLGDHTIIIRSNNGVTQTRRVTIARN